MPTIRSAIRDVFAQLDDRFRKQQELPPPSGRTLLDPSCTLLPGDLALVGTRRDEDAELVLSIIALDAAYSRDVLLIVQDEWWAQVLLLSIKTDIPAEAIAHKTLTSDAVAQLREAARLLNTLPIEMSRSSGYKNEFEVVEKWLELHPGGIVVMPAAWPASLGNDEQGAAAFVRELKEIARTYDGAIAIPWHLNDHRRLDKRPQLRDLAVSGAAEDDADLVLLFHSSEYGVEITLAKNRHGATGHVYETLDASD